MPFSVLRQRDLDVDDPRTTQLWQKIVKRKGFLKSIYDEWYSEIVAWLPSDRGAILELGSGAGFLRERVADLVTSDILTCPGVRTVLDAHCLPFCDQSLGAVVMTDVIHHLPRVQSFFSEAGRCVRPQGRIIMVEPWVTPWSRLVYQHLHPEPINLDTESWAFESSGPLSGANSALPWILFSRDREQFARQFPEWHIMEIKPLMPFRYLLSGGLSPFSFMPPASFGLWRRFETALEPWMGNLAMFALLVLERR